jgi:hemoglobin/transferrin/lactoferrin receptor protein
VVANKNVNKAYVLGVNARLKIDFCSSVSLDNTISYTYGRIKSQGGIEKPLDHIPPVFGKSSLMYNEKKLSMELYCLYNGWKKIRNFNPDGEDNGQYATVDGMPAWFTVNWRGSYALTKYLTLQTGVENILDRNYRYFASGFSAPGLNFIVAVRATL